MNSTKTNMPPPPTRRFCKRCDKLTIWEYNPISQGIGHSYCTKCGSHLEANPHIELQTQKEYITSLNVIIQKQAKKITELTNKITELEKQIIIFEIKQIKNKNDCKSSAKVTNLK